MARLCSVCTHPQVEDINISLALRTPARAIVEQFSNDIIKLSEAAVHRHSVNHLGDQAVRTLVVKGHADDMLEAGLLRDHSVVLQLLAQTLATCQDIMKTALDNDKPDMALKAAKEVQNSLALIHKFTAKVEGPQVDPVIQEELKDLTQALARVLPNHREAAKDLIKELKMLGKIAMAESIANRLLIIDGDLV